jgi:hypothetical protein
MPEQVNLAAGYTVVPGAETIKHITYSVIFCSIIYCSLLVLLSSRRLVRASDELARNNVQPNTQPNDNPV